VRKQDERIGCQPLGSYKKEMKDFNEFIEKMELFDIPMVGRRYTWYRTNGRQNKDWIGHYCPWNGWMFGHNVNNML